MEPIEQWKKEFEEWADGYPGNQLDKRYLFQAWKAAKRSQPVVELPNPFHDSVSGYECDELHESLDAAGIQYRIKGE